MDLQQHRQHLATGVNDWQQMIADNTGRFSDN
jgi:hypothetical protein